MYKKIQKKIRISYFNIQIQIQIFKILKNFRFQISEFRFQISKFQIEIEISNRNSNRKDQKNKEEGGKTGRRGEVR